MQRKGTVKKHDVEVLKEVWGGKADGPNRSHRQPGTVF